MAFPDRASHILKMLAKMSKKCSKVLKVTKVYCLAKKSVGLKNLQKLGGKMISFGLAVPASRLYASAIFKAIFTAISTGRAVPLKGDLLDEISLWRFLDTWSGFSSLASREAFPCTPLF